MQITLEGLESPIRANAGDTILESLLRAGVPFPFSCQFGTCGTCRCQLLQGNVTELERHGKRTALVCGEDAVGFGELAQLVARSAAAHAALGVARGEKVLLLMRDTPEFAAAWLGLLHI